MVSSIVEIDFWSRDANAISRMANFSMIVRREWTGAEAYYTIIKKEKEMLLE